MAKDCTKLAVGFRILSVGIQIACAGLPLAVDPKLLETIKDEADFMKELVSHLELEGKVDSDISSDSEEFVSALDNKTVDLRQKDSEDLNRIARQQLAELL
ncbi:hypothetical protein H8E88_16050 [candidate division KSB1 bacterium]|nr:hypothetical protein [candidate division KSB1 bacterium]